ncbi:hypothetical protein C1701_26365 [Actinoalloteichus sp. AHMU CJ021]|uniref:Uncharacterized protein n=1 Tax=Actinoalloteichus caeruleus DSM 43889 TaxID=1120930 RepID=A0ABT1JF22_ACTCY|nr:hypothetical protein [Actinoalloteichus caeruleus]AUS81260.1 hypothetical protein C1701_26365 [Actinoalloteichus sp. AHMU CJ021]MCP2330778.1 hypothetical protein [Actinoalloteichus caeruleus DSM 43889]
MTTHLAHPPPTRSAGVIEILNTSRHEIALVLYGIVVLAHWLEHVAQAAQIYLFDWPVPEAGGALGLAFPWLVESELLHYGFALVMIVAFFVLRHGFGGRARTWWGIALGIQFWHHIEHLLLLLQAWSGVHLLSRPVPTSIIQLVMPRVELHLLYNAIVFVPMVVAMVLHRRGEDAGEPQVRCSCARVPSGG